MCGHELKGVIAVTFPPASRCSSPSRRHRDSLTRRQAVHAALNLVLVLWMSGCFQPSPSAGDLAHGVAPTPLLDADPTADLDHDGEPNSVDRCPTVWSPGNDAAPCATWNAAGWLRSAPLSLSEAALPTGQSSHRRSNEIVDVPLVNGWVDASVAAYFTLDDHDRSIGEQSLSITRVGELKSGPDSRKNPLFAVKLQGKGHLQGAPLGSLLSGERGLTLCVRFRLDGPPSAGGVSLLGDADGLAVGDGADSIAVQVIGGKLTCRYSSGTTNTPQELRSTDVVTVGTWHQACLILGPSQTVFGCMLDDRIVGAMPLKSLVRLSKNRPLTMGRRRSATGDWVQALVGSVDDLLVVGRTMSSQELATLSRSGQPLGSARLPGAQVDLDDVRITEITPQQGAHLTHVEVRGVLPHSDTQLGDVLAYWRLDGDGSALFEAAKGVASPSKSDATTTVDLNWSKPPAWTWGRFGDPQGAVSLTPDLRATTAQLLPVGQQTFTVEAWVLLAPERVQHPRCLFEQRNGAGGVRVCLSGDGQELSCGVGAQAPLMVALPTSDREPISAWRHIGCTFDKGMIRLYVDGGLLAQRGSSMTTEAIAGAWLSTTLGAGAGPDSSLLGRMDEVLVHGVARGAAYFAARARGLPRLRFLAHTAAEPSGSDRWSIYSYMIHWFNPAVAGKRTALRGLHGEHCSTLASSCLGMLGWWPMQEWYGGRAIDEVGGHDAVAAAAALPSRRVGRIAVQAIDRVDEGGQLGAPLEGGSSSLIAPMAAKWSVFDAVTLEAVLVARQLVTSASRPLISLLGRDPEDRRLGIQHDQHGLSVVAGPIAAGQGEASLGDGCLPAPRACRVAIAHRQSSSSLWLRANETLSMDAWRAPPLFGRRPADTMTLRFGGSTPLNSAVSARHVRLSRRALQPDELLPKTPLRALLPWPQASQLLIRSPDGAGVDDGSLRLYGIHGDQLLPRPRPHWLRLLTSDTGIVADVLRFDDHKYIAVLRHSTGDLAGDGATQVEVRNVRSGKLVRSITGRGWRETPALAWRRDGTLLFRTASAAAKAPGCAFAWHQLAPLSGAVTPVVRPAALGAVSVDWLRRRPGSSEWAASVRYGCGANTADVLILDHFGHLKRRVTDDRGAKSQKGANGYTPGTADIQPIWSRDGSTLFWSRNQEELWPHTGAVWRQQGSSAAERIWIMLSDETPYLWNVWPPDDRLVVVQRNVGAGLGLGPPSNASAGRTGLGLSAVTFVRLWR